MSWAYGEERLCGRCVVELLDLWSGPLESLVGVERFEVDGVEQCPVCFEWYGSGDIEICDRLIARCFVELGRQFDFCWRF